MNYSESRFSELERLRRENLRLKQEIAALQSKEGELSDSRRQLSTLLANIPGMAYRCRNDRHWTMLFVSEGCLDLTGYPPCDLMSNSNVAYNDLIHPEDRERVKQAVNLCQPAGSKFEVCYRLVDASRNLKWVWERGVGVFDEHGNLLFLEGFVTDVTEQKRQEEQCRHFQRLESTAQMVQGIAHEFNNLLQGMTSAAELLSWRGGSDIKGKKYLQQLHSSLDQFKQLVARLVSAGRRSGFHFEPISFDEVVRETLEVIEPVLPSNIRIDRAMHAAKSSVYADSKQLEQALINILTNAVEAIGAARSGLIELKTEVRTIAQIPGHAEEFPGLQTGTYCLLTVSDNGPGMDEETLRRAFDPFYSKKSFHGTGLGLSIAYSIIKGHQGYIYCHSREGEGASFSVFLPLKESLCSLEERGTKPAEPAGQEHSERKTLFVAGIEDASPSKAVELLKSQGYRIIESAQHHEALEAYIHYAGQVDAVLADPDTFGLEPQRFMKALFQIDPDVGLIILSAGPLNTDGHPSGLSKNIRLLSKQQAKPEQVVREAKRLLHGQGPLI